MTGAMDLEIVPEPTADERAAIAEALARLPEPGARERGAWWRAGLEESLADPADGDGGEPG